MKLKKILAGAMAGAMVLGSLTITSAAIAEPDELIDGLVAYYSFDDTLENAVTGASATIQGGAGDTWFSTLDSSSYNSDTAVAGSSYYFAGTADGANADGLMLDVTATKEYTFSYWINATAVTSATSQVFIAQTASDGSSTNGLNIADNWFGETYPTVRIWSDIGDFSDTYLDNWISAPTGEWHYITLTCDGENVVLYYDGVSVATGTTGSDFTGCNIFLGVNWWDTTFEGYMDEVTVYDTALTADQVATLYSSNGYPYETGIYGDSDTIYMTVDQEGRSAADYIALYPSTLSGVTYEVTDGADYVSVAKDGTITAIAKGTATITATYTGSENVTNKEVTLTVSVTDPNSVTGITSSISEATLTVGNTITLSGSLVGEKSTSPITDNCTVNFASSDTSVATVNESTGVVTAVAEGTATITITVTGTDSDGVAYTYNTTVALTVEAAEVVTTEATTETTTETETTSTGTSDSDTTDTETESESEEAVYTLVNEYDMDDTTIETWWELDSFTDSIALEESHQYVITGTTTNLSTSNWNNVLYVLFSSDDGAVYASTDEAAAAANYVEYFVGRADNYGWQGDYNTAGELPDGLTYTCVSAPADDDAWAEWLITKYLALP